MIQADDFKLKRQMGAERIMLMLPLNVIMVAKIIGEFSVADLAAALAKLKKRHALLAVRTVRDENDEVWYLSEDVPEFSIETIKRSVDEQWMQTAADQFKKSFQIEKGPLIRFVLIHSREKSDMVICAHHVICDGFSLAYLIRDILRHLAAPQRKVDLLPEPPLISRTTVSFPPRSNLLKKTLIGLFNRQWARKKIRFTLQDRKKLHERFWEANRRVNIMAWESTAAETAALVARCREENVTVNTAIWTAFLAAQHDTIGDDKGYRHKAGMAVNIRDKLTIPVGEAFGFYAASLTALLKYRPSLSFWETARRFHGKITDTMKKTDPFRMLSADTLHPTLIDSIYFSKYRLIKNRLSDKLLTKMNWHRINYGYAITNVGRVPIPVHYGPLHLDSVYGPLIYSDVNEKTVGVITVEDKITYLVSHNEKIVSKKQMEQIKEKTIHHLNDALAR